MALKALVRAKEVRLQDLEHPPLGRGIGNQLLHRRLER